MLITRVDRFCLQTDIFDLPAVDIGQISQVIVGHTLKGRGKGWFCDRVSIQTSSEDTEKELLFPCNRWMDTGCEDRKLERTLVPLGEMPVVAEGTNNEPESSENLNLLTIVSCL